MAVVLLGQSGDVSRLLYSAMRFQYTERWHFTRQEHRAVEDLNGTALRS